MTSITEITALRVKSGKQVRFEVIGKSASIKVDQLEQRVSRVSKRTTAHQQEHQRNQRQLRIDQPQKS
jgi:hypothetical protein